MTHEDMQEPQLPFPQRVLAGLDAKRMEWKVKNSNHFTLPLLMTIVSGEYKRSAMAKLAAKAALEGAEVTVYGRASRGESPIRPSQLGFREFAVVEVRDGEPTGEGMRGDSLSSHVVKLGRIASHDVTMIPVDARRFEQPASPDEQ